MAQVKGKILGGIIWSVANQIGLQILTVIFTAVLSRLLLPSDFGLIAMVTLATGFLVVLRDFGFGAALVQKKEVSQEEYSSVFWLNVIVGSFLSILIWLSAPFIASFYSEPALEGITKSLSFTFLLTSAGIVLNNILIKQMEFKQIFYRSLLSTLVSGIATIILALNGFGYWALIAQVYFNTISNLLFTYSKVRWRPSFLFKKKLIKDMMPFSLPLIGNQSLNYWTRNVDNLLIGKVFGSADLAFYNRAYSLMLLPVKQITGTITKVLFPSFSLIQDDIEQIRRIYFKVSGVIALLAFPLMTYLFVMGKEVILLLYGETWLRTVPIFKILCLLGMLQSIGALIGNVFISQGKTGLLMRIGLLSKGIMISGIIGGVFLGSVYTVALCYVSSSLLAFIPETYYLAKILKTTLVKVLSNLLNQFICSAIMGGILMILSPQLKLFIYMKLGVSLMIACSIYLALIVLTKDRSWLNLLTLINEKRKGKIFSLKS